MVEVTALLERAQQDIAAARSLIAQEFHAVAISRSYYAAFYAAEGALLALGKSRSKHSGVISGFGEFVVRGEGFDKELGAVLRRLFDLRIDVDYSLLPPTEEDAMKSVDDAQRFVNAVTAWINERRTS